tara:strand:- start:21573 stop:22244 length:672 start_codon:yes stop_codon:yes gene_type:complete
VLIDIHCHNIEYISPTAVLTLDIDTPIPHQNFFNFGIHPWSAQTFQLFDIAPRLSTYINDRNFLMLGEIGLDRSCAVDFQSQIDLFAAQVEFARTNNVNTLLIHCVRSLSDILQVINKAHYNGRLVFHDTNFSLQDLNHITKLGHFISFGDNLFRENSKAVQFLTHIDQTKLLLESGDGNHSTFQVYERAAALLELEVKKLNQRVLKNFQSLFVDHIFPFDFE